MLNKLTNFFVKFMQRYMPDPFLFVVVLTFVTFILAKVFTTTSIVDMIDYWYSGLWKILSFAMQMILILVTGYTLAETKPIKIALFKLASIVKSQHSGAVIIFITAAIASFINWGLGLIIGAILAKEVAKKLDNRGIKADFGYIVAAAYMGFIVWTSGLSSSIALIIATPKSELNFIEQNTGYLAPLSETVFATYNLIGVMLIVIFLIIYLYFTRLKDSDIKNIKASVLESFDKETSKGQKTSIKKTQENTFASKLENAWILSLIIFVLGIIYLFRSGLSMDINKFIFIMFLAGIILHFKPITYVKAFNDAAKVSGPLILQYPLYGGIMGLIINSGLANVIAGWFISFSTQYTLPFWSFISSIIISIFIPSGGGHWAVQGPIMVPAAMELHASQAKVAMAIAYGEQVANMIQPFWALPILAIAKLGAKDIMGYCVVAFILGTIVYGSILF